MDELAIRDLRDRLRTLITLQGGRLEPFSLGLRMAYKMAEKELTAIIGDGETDCVQDPVDVLG